MKRSRLPLIAVLAALVILALAAPAFATEGSTEEPEETTTTVAPFEGDDAPAVIIPPAEETEEDQPWTSRFIYPTIVVGTILLIVGIVWAYNRRVRHRYKVVSD